MTNITKEDVIKWLSNLTVIEVADLIKELEKTWGVSATMPMIDGKNQSLNQENNTKEEVKEKTEFEVILSSVGIKKISVIKVIREITGFSLQESKSLVDNAPKLIKKNINKLEAENIQKKLEEVGAKIEIK